MRRSAQRAMNGGTPDWQITGPRRPSPPATTVKRWPPESPCLRSSAVWTPRKDCMACTSSSISWVECFLAKQGFASPRVRLSWRHCSQPCSAFVQATETTVSLPQYLGGVRRPEWESGWSAVPAPGPMYSRRPKPRLWLAFRLPLQQEWGAFGRGSRRGGSRRPDHPWSLLRLLRHS